MDSGELPTVERLGKVSTSSVSEDKEHPRGTAIDRYLVLSRLGSGGMGIVYAAYDGDLNRKVALKMLHTRGDPDGTFAEALRREAQALARVSHPNVVAVFDVGTFSGEIYLVMELVDGVTLREWFDHEPRHWRQVVRCLAGAGRGLSAVHQRGLAHQDFKPANVLVDGNGEARVSDFGLARVEGTRSDAKSQPLPGPTLLGGTPGYMAPEQWAGKAADARADQFAFCVVLYEGLYRELPFGRESLHGRPALEMAATPTATAVPVWIRRVILRGLSLRPEDRFESMAALLVALETDPAQARGKQLRRASLALGAVALIGYYPLQQAWKHRGCVRSAAQRVAWSDARIDGLRAGFKGENARVEAMLGAHAARLEHELVTACDAALPEVLTCLNRRNTELQALTSLFSRIGSEVADKALIAADGLPTPASCRVPPPVERALNPDEPLRQQLAQGKVLQLAGRNDEALPIFQQVFDGSGADLEARAEALLLLGQSQLEMSKPADAKKTFARAVNAAERAGNLELAASAWASMGYVTGSGLDQYDEGIAHLEHATAILEQLGKPALLSGFTERNVGHVLQRAGRFEEAAAAYQRAIDFGEAGEPGLALANALTGMTGALRQQGKLDEARRTIERALAIREGKLGHEHLEVGVSRNALGNVLHDQGAMEAAADQFEKAAQIFEKLQGPKSQRLAFVLSNKGNCLSVLGRHDEALVVLERGLRIREEVLGKQHTETAISHNSLGSAAMRRGQWATAKASFERALAIHVGRGPEHPSVALTNLNLAGALLASRQPEEAIAALTRAMTGIKKVATGVERLETLWGVARVAQGKTAESFAHFDKALAGEKPADAVVLEARVGRGRAFASMGKTTEAMVDLEAALASVRDVVEAPEQLAEGQLALAELLEKTDPKRSGELAQRARTFYLKADDRAAEATRATAVIDRVKE